MENRVDAYATPQGFGDTKTERLPCPERSAMNGAQRAAADAIINGPRKAIFRPVRSLTTDSGAVGARREGWRNSPISRHAAEPRP